jgi:antitoxin component of MazEF toxin-antitoxin module
MIKPDDKMKHLSSAYRHWEVVYAQVGYAKWTLQRWGNSCEVMLNKLIFKDNVTFQIWVSESSNIKISIVNSHLTLEYIKDISELFILNQTCKRTTI